MNDYQIIIIGSGPGGHAAALHAASLGIRTAVVEDREVGGTCLNRGCVPTKALLHASEVYHSAKNGAAMGVLGESVSFDLRGMFDYKDNITKTLSSGLEGSFKSAKVTLLRGRGRITAPGVVEVTDAEGNVTTHTADDIIIATGSVPSRPPIPGLDLPGVMTSDELLMGADAPFKSLVVIGGGVIGVELASFYADLGCEVTIVEGLDRLLPNMDRELGQNLALILKKQGVKVFTNSMVAGIEQDEAGLRVSFKVKDQVNSVTGEAVLCAIGRWPYCEGLFGEGLAPEMNRRFIKVDEHFRTSIPHVYAVGDVSSLIQLAHVASAQGEACVDFIVGNPCPADLSVVPKCIYCRPEIASVGITDAEAKQEGIPVKVGKCVMGGNARTMIADPGRSFMKLVAHAETGVLLGAHLMCPNSTDIISELSQAIANRMTAVQLLAAMRPHPTFEEALTEALRDLIAKLNK